MAETPHLIVWLHCGRAPDKSRLWAEFNQLQSFPALEIDVIVLFGALEARVQLVQHGMAFPSRATLPLPFRLVN
jgi:hypothetical protein